MKNSLKWLILILILALALSACERPVPGAQESQEPPTAPTGEQPPILTIPTTPPEAQPIPQEPYPAPGEGSTAVAPTEPGTTAPGGETTAPPVEQPVEETPPPADAGTGDSSAPSTPPTGERIHIVKAGENLFRIGLQYGFTYQELAAYNGISNPNSIQVGQEIRIPPTP